MKKKYILYLFITIFLFNSFNICTYAADGSVGSLETSSHEQESDKPYEPVIYKKEWGDSKNSKVSYTCEYSYNNYTSDTISVNAYDLSDDPQKLLPNSFSFDDYSATAGMALRFNIKETKAVGYNNLKFEVTKVTEGSTSNECTSYTYNYTPINISSTFYCLDLYSNCKNKGNCHPDAQGKCKYSAVCSHWKTVKKLASKEKLSSGTEYDKCKDLVIKEATNKINSMTSGGNYKIKATDSNKQDAILSLPFTILGSASKIKCNADKTSCENKKTFEYTMSNVCMNLASGDVAYGRTCEKGEIKIADYNDGKDNYFHYFVPLTATSDSDNIMISVTNNHVYKKDVCIQTMDKNSKYMDFLIPNSNNNFTGMKANDKLMVNNGCMSAINIKIPIKQEFFKEIKTTDGKLKLDDHNFYYRKINVDNPFPLGIDAGSLWTEWYNSNYAGGVYKPNSVSLKPNIRDSYGTVTYVSDRNQVENSKSINTKYLEWKNMTSSGLNTLINNGLVATRHILAKNIYDLGMGPGVCLLSGAVVSSCPNGFTECKCIK